MKSNTHHPANTDKIQWLRAFLSRWNPESRVASGAADLLLTGSAPSRILALGKAGRALARGASLRWPGTPGFLLETRHGAPGLIPGSFQHYRGEHPLPGDNSRKATQALYRWLQETSGPLLALISGGGTALLSDPPPPWTHAQVLSLERTLLHSGAAIAEMNAVRASLSNARGGGLLLRMGEAPVCTGVWCDVAARDWERTSSGPTFAPLDRPDADAVLRRLGISPPHPLPPPHHIEVRRSDVAACLADCDKLARDCVRQLQHLGWNAHRITCPEGTAPGALAARFSAAARQVSARPAALVGAGEAPVHVSGDGRGGRCSHLAVTVALELSKEKGWTFAALATDGIDGGAGGGALLSWRDRIPAKESRRALLASDTGTLLKAEGLLIPRGATGNNLRDLWVLFLEPARG